MARHSTVKACAKAARIICEKMLFLWRNQRGEPEKMGPKQEHFSVMYVCLLLKAFELGFDVRMGHVLRCRDCHTGRKTSLHKDKLAGDLNLFKDGVYLTETSDHEELGVYWESIGGSWGGRFKDGNHYSLTHQGRR